MRPNRKICNSKKSKTLSFSSNFVALKQFGSCQVDSFGFFVQHINEKIKA